MATVLASRSWMRELVGVTAMTIISVIRISPITIGPTMPMVPQ